MSNKPETVREARIYDSVADFPPAGEYGVGSIRNKNGIEYWSDGYKYTKTASSVSEAPLAADTIEKTDTAANYVITGSVTENEIRIASSSKTLTLNATAGNARIQKNLAGLTLGSDAATSPLLVSFYVEAVPTADNNIVQTDVWLANDTGLPATTRSQGQISTAGSIGWNTVSLEKAGVASTPYARPFVAVGTGPVDFTTTIQSYRIDVNSGAGRVRHIDAILDGYKERPKVCLTLDDAFKTGYSVGYKEAKKRNIKLTQFPMFDTFGTGDYQTLAQLEQQASDPLVYMGVNGLYRWDKTGSGAALDPYTEIKRNIDGIKSLGLSDGLYGTWPDGRMATDNKTVAMDAAKAAGLLGARSTVARFQHFYTFNPFAIRSIPLSSSTTIAWAKLAIDYAINWGCSVCFYGHKFGTADSITWAIADWIELLDYIATKRSIGLIDDMRFDEYVQYGYQTTVLDDPLDI